MRKYPMGEKSVGAIYDNAPVDNPFLAALPEMLSQDDFKSEIRSFPKLPFDLPSMTSEERRQALTLLPSIFVPLNYMYAIFDQLYRAIRSTYSTWTMLEEVRQTNALFRGSSVNDYSTQAATGSILGVPGVGKTSTIRRSLALLPQVIEHMEYMGKPFYCKQVLYLTTECPSDCSVKSLALNLVAALDRAVGSNYLRQLTSLRSVAASAVAAQVKVLCLTHHVGLILIDEIQNAEALFVSQEHLKRRTRGIRLLPFKPDGAYRAFLEQLWPYQFTTAPAPLTDQLANKLYDWAGGNPAYIVKIFQESQVQTLLQGRNCIDGKTMQKAIDLLAIKVPKTFSGGTHISDFDFAPDAAPEESADPLAISSLSEIPTGEAANEVPRLYAHKRGRPVMERDAADLLAALKAGADLLGHLRSLELLEVF